MITSETEKNNYQAALLKNRLTKRFKLLRKWARKEQVTCYRIYDKDIPEIPLAIDLYTFLPEEIQTKQAALAFTRQEEKAISENNAAAIAQAEDRRWLHLFLYERPYERDAQLEEAWLKKMAEAARMILHVQESHVITKLRKKQRGENQYEKNTQVEGGGIGLVQECGEIFKINLREYLDTGLFFDHRPLRKLVRASSKGKRVLNLFCYTGSFSVYAAAGGASFVESVDLSNTYLSWAVENMHQNNFFGDVYCFTRSDVCEFLAKKTALPDENENRYDIIILDPPTFSNSKALKTIFDVNRDWASLCSNCLELLNAGGTLYFSTNSRKLIFDQEKLPQITKKGKAICISDITEESLPEDFKGSKNRRCWKLQIAK